MTAPVRIGTSGFAFREWVGPFYPRGLGEDELLPAYAERLRAVELTATFHRLPPAATAEHWRGLVPNGFRFCVTTPRALTRDLKTVRSSGAVEKLHRLAEALGSFAGPVLVQLPATGSVDLGGLDHLLEALAGLRVAVELRHPAWHSDACLRMLSAHDAALVLRDDAGGVPRLETTAGFTYLRLRRAGETGLDLLADRLALLARRGIEVFAFLRHDRGARAALLAMELDVRVRERLEPGRRRPSPEIVLH